MKFIILAGGSGTRLWPLSRTDYPKQFIKLIGHEKSIIQLTVERCLLLGSPDDIYIVTSKDYLHLINKQMEQIGVCIPKEQCLLEPQGKNTLPAIMYAVKSIREKGDDICTVFASDQLINSPQTLADVIINSSSLAKKGFVCFGVAPDAPETGYGYIKPGNEVHDNDQGSNELQNSYEVAAFHEKPDIETAKRFIRNGYLWNSGIFMFHSAQFTDAVKEYCPKVYGAFQNNDVAMIYEQTPSISIDYGLIEKLKRCYCVLLPVKWNDLGSFNAFFDEYEAYKDNNGNISLNDEIIIDSNDNFIYSKTDKAVAVVGVSDLVIVNLDDALLICHRDQVQKVKTAVDKLREREDKRA